MPPKMTLEGMTSSGENPQLGEVLGDVVWRR
jgi:hypothetical protein